MQEITIKLTQSMKEFIDCEIASGRHANASEVFSYLVRMEEKRKAYEVLAKLIEEAENSGPEEEITPEFWDEMRRRVREKASSSKAVS